MNKLIKLNIATLLVILLVLGGITLGFSAYSGEQDFGKAILGVAWNGVKNMFAVATSGQASPTGGLFPMAGTDGTCSRGIKVNSQGVLGTEIIAASDAASAAQQITTTGEVAVATPAAGKQLLVKSIQVSSDTANEVVLKEGSGGTVRWRAFLPAGGFAQSPGGLGWLFTVNAGASVQFTNTTGNVNLRYQEQ